jgi:eukaryotic-like serine/threonine-protein kinase
LPPLPTRAVVAYPVDVSSASSAPDPAEDLLAEAVQVLEQHGEAGLQQFLGQHGSVAESLRSGLERLRRMGMLAPPPAPIEARQFGEFRVLHRLGQGGMGVVYAAVQTSLQRQVALKVVRPELLLSSTARERFQREVETVARLNHPGIVPILAVGNDPAQPWFAMEFVDGRSLDDLLQSLRGTAVSRATGGMLRSAFEGPGAVGSGTSGAFAGSYWETCVRIVQQVAATMSYVHARGIVHRDLKPSNILLTPQGQAMVLDFGLAHVQDLQRMTRQEAPVGSPAYMAPEQVRGDAVDERVDVYGLGVTLYQLLTMQLPFRAESPAALEQAILTGGSRPVRAWNRAVPRDLEVVCAVAIDRDRDRRYRTMADFAADLDRVLHRQPIQARPPAVWLRMVRFAQRHPTGAIAAGAVLLIALQFPLVLWWQQAAAGRRLETANLALAAAARDQQATNAALAASNAELERQRRTAEADFDDALVTIQEMLVRTGQTELASTPGSEGLRLGLLQRAGILYARLGDRRAGDPRLELEAARVDQYLGSLQKALGRGDVAEAALQRSLDRLQARGDAEALTIRAVAAKLLGQALHARGASAEAERRLRDGACWFEQAALQRAPDRSDRRQQSELWNSLALVRAELGDRGEALELLQRAQAIKMALVAEAPQELDGLLALAIGSSNLAGALDRAGRREAAVTLLTSAIAQLCAVAPSGPEAATYRARLAGLFDRLGTMRQEAGRLGDAEVDLGAAIALREELRREFPDIAEHRRTLAGSWHNLAMTWSLGKRHEEALAAELDSIENARAALRMAALDRTAGQFLEYALVGRCSALLKLSRLDELLPAIGELGAAARSTDGMLNAARLGALGARKLLQRDGAKAAATAEQWRARAVGWVEQAVAMGFADAAHFTAKPFGGFYDDLRDRPAFQAAMARLAARAR